MKEVKAKGPFMITNLISRLFSISMEVKASE